MKTLQKFKYILFALMVLGFFANFAKNEYGFQIVGWVGITLFLIFLFETIYYGIKETPNTSIKSWKIKSIRFLGPITAGLFILNIISTILFSGTDDYLWLEYSLNLGLVGSIIAYVILASVYKPLFIESLSLFLYFTGFLLKSNHWFGGGYLLMLSSILLIIYFITNLVGRFRNERKYSLQAASYILLAYLFIIFNQTGLTFKTQHWPGPEYIESVAAVLLLIIVISLIFRKQFIYPSGKVSLWRLLGNVKGNFSLIFIFYALAVIQFVLSMMGIVPSFYSTARPPAMNQLLWVDNGQERFDKYWKAYYGFLDHRRETEEKEKKK